MADKTQIEWTDATWNPVRGCSRVSPGCGGPNHEGGCYAEKIAARFSGPGQAFEGFAERTAQGGRWTGKVEVVWDAIDIPIRWRKPRRIFANSMSDLFHEALDVVDVAMIYGTAIAAVHLRKHTIQILTKRAEHMREVLTDPIFWEVANDHAEHLVLEHTDPLNRRSDDARATLGDYGPGKPPPGIWLGVSVEDQERADERIPHLLAAPAAVRFLSCEPLLGPVMPWTFPIYTEARRLGADDGRLDWLIAGGESGPAARPAHPDWLRALRDQCQEAFVPFFFKQWGEWADPGNVGANSWTFSHTKERRSYGRVAKDFVDLFDGKAFETEFPFPVRSPAGYDPGPAMVRLGKKTAGATLDGREWREFPT